mgnify:FL=1
MITETTLLDKLAGAYGALKNAGVQPYDTTVIQMSRGELSICIKAIQAALAIRALVDK